MNNKESHNKTLGLLVIIAPLLYELIGQGCFVLIYLSLLGITFYFFRQNRIVNFSKIDVCVSFYLIYGLCNLFFVKENRIDDLFILQWIFLISIYIIARGVKDKKIEVLYFITISGMIQSVIGILQLNGWMESGHSEFAMTGSFLNPGPYGGYLAISLLSAVIITIETERKAERVGSIVFSLLLFVMLLLSASRAGLLAVVCGVFYLIFEKIRLKNRILSVIIAISTLSLFCVVLYFLRTGSADVRLLLWRVCMTIFMENPIVGTGVASLPSIYMNYQADYFTAFPNSIFIDVANNHGQAFNELIHIACEQGIIGLGIFFTILFLVFKSECERGVKALVLSLLVFSCFSYPADVLPLKMMFPLFIGLSTKSVFYRMKLPRWIGIVPLLLIPSVIVLNFHYKKAFSEIRVSTTPTLPQNQDYMLQYAKINETVETLNYLSTHIYSSSDIMCDMGDAYINIGDTLSADRCYQRALKMVPNRILPLYNLFLMYQGRDEAIMYALKIINLKPKITNSLTLRAKAQSKEYLKLNLKENE